MKEGFRGARWTSVETPRSTFTARIKTKCKADWAQRALALGNGRWASRSPKREKERVQTAHGPPLRATLTGRTIHLPFSTGSRLSCVPVRWFPVKRWLLLGETTSMFWEPHSGCAPLAVICRLDERGDPQGWHGT